MHIGGIIRQKRKSLSLTQDELAAKSQVTQSMISKLEAGSIDNVSLEALRKLAKALRCSVVDLLPEEDKRAP